jgi:Secretion system C-terminal sorting domain
LATVNYYRLKQTDFDGKTSLSKILSINNGNANKSSLKVTPSVISDNLTVEIETEDVGTLHIIDTAGRTVFTKNKIAKGLSTQHISINGLPNGVYFLSFLSKSGQTTEKFVKQ